MEKLKRRSRKKTEDLIAIAYISNAFGWTSYNVAVREAIKDRDKEKKRERDDRNGDSMKRTQK